MPDTAAPTPEGLEGDGERLRDLVYNRRVHSPSDIGTTLEWGDLKALVEDATLDFAQFGACRGMDANFFYPPKGQAVAPARAVCEGCPVRLECLAWALRHETQGVWGGASVGQRRALRHKLRIHVATPEALPANCGSMAGYKTHLRAGEDPCVQCRRANATYQGDRRAWAS